MHADLDSLLTALYVLVDDLLPMRKGAGRRPKITDAELIALAVAQILLDCHSERRFLRFARWRLAHLFPYIPKQPGYNKRLRSLAPRICLVINQLARISPSFGDRLRLLDSTPVPCGASRETVKRSELARPRSTWTTTNQRTRRGFAAASRSSCVCSMTWAGRRSPTESSSS